ncbi:MAG TPA: AMP-binding protein [Candidatus Obscuribacterales bacterium]
MITFQDALSRLLCPTAGRADFAPRPAIIQARAADGSMPDRAVTYGQLEELVGRAQAGLTEAGVREGDTVLLCAPNSPELVAAILSTWRLGAVALPVDFRLTGAEVDNLVARLEPRAVVSVEPISQRAVTVRLGALPEAPAGFDGRGLDRVSQDGLALVILTSGTTGVPKGAVHDLGSLINNVSELAATFGLRADDRAFLPLPTSHIFGMAVLLAQLLTGGCIVLSDFHPADFWNTVTRLKVTMVVGVPTIYGALINLPSPPANEIPVQQYLSGGAPLPVSLAHEFEKRFTRRIVQGYGTTETKILCFNKDGPPESVGRPLPSVVIEIVDQNDEVVGEGDSGEIRIAGPSLMKGYLNQPEASAQVLHRGHYHTGDIGYIRDGLLYISGRSKEMIIVAGNKVFPSEVETVLRQHPLAHEVAVLGVPHRKLGQLVKAVIVVKSGELCDLLCGDEAMKKQAKEELNARFREFCQQHLKRELRPMEWEFRPISCPLPKTLTGKIDKKQLEATPA